MADIDLNSLRAVMAQRTPGEWKAEGNELYYGDGRHQQIPRGHDCAAIVAAVNAIGPLLERVRELEREKRDMMKEIEQAGLGFFWDRIRK